MLIVRHTDVLRRANANLTRQTRQHLHPSEAAGELPPLSVANASEDEEELALITCYQTFLGLFTAEPGE